MRPMVFDMNLPPPPVAPSLGALSRSGPGQLNISGQPSGQLSLQQVCLELKLDSVWQESKAAPAALRGMMTGMGAAGRMALKDVNASGLEVVLFPLGQPGLEDLARKDPGIHNDHLTGWKTGQGSAAPDDFFCLQGQLVHSPLSSTGEGIPRLIAANEPNQAVDHACVQSGNGALDHPLPNDQGDNIHLSAKGDEDEQGGVHELGYDC